MKLYTILGYMRLLLVAESQELLRYMYIGAALLKLIPSSGLSIGGEVNPLVSQHVHAGRQQSRVRIKIQKLLHEKSKLPRKFQSI